jgi:ribosome-binding factor A
MTLPGRRADRLAHEIRVILAEMLTREVRDPRIGFATVTRVEMSGDLHHARVMISVIGTPEAQEESIEGLASAAGFIRHELGHRLALRRAPELTFILDHSAEEVERVAMLLEKIHKEMPPSE